MKKLLCLMLCLLLLCSALVSCSEKKTDLEQIEYRIGAFLHGYNTGDFELITECMDEKSRNQLKAMEGLLSSINLGFGIGGFSVSSSLNFSDLFGFSVGTISGDGDLMTLEPTRLIFKEDGTAELYTDMTFSTTFASTEESLVFDLVKENGDWYISDMSN